MAHRPAPGPRPFPARPIDRLLDPWRRFTAIEAASGVLLLAVTALALVLANSPWRDGYESFINTRVSLGFGAASLDYPLWYWVNDGLMALFFFVVGLEIKRERVSGELKDTRQAMLPVMAAVGGAIFPAVIFTALAGAGPAAAGWGIPMATDIAFVVGAMALLGARVPHALKVFVLSAAIVDDLLAVVVIALFYAQGLSLAWLGAAAAGLAVVALANRLGVRSIGVYVLLGLLVWFFTLKSGVHPTIAGVILGLMTPATAWLGRREAAAAVATSASALDRGDWAAPRGDLDTLATAGREAVSPLERLESALHPWVAYAIMPIFAFVNAGVPLGGVDFGGGVALAVALGLLFGKPLGITLFAWLAVRLAGSRLPAGATWPMMLATGLLAGVGFTMSLFIASLALEGSLLTDAKGGILLGSGVAITLGLAALLRATRRPATSDPTA